MIISFYLIEFSPNDERPGFCSRTLYTDLSSLADIDLSSNSLPPPPPFLHFSSIPLPYLLTSSPHFFSPSSVYPSPLFLPPSPPLSFSKIRFPNKGNPSRRAYGHAPRKTILNFKVTANLAQRTRAKARAKEHVG